MNNIETPVRHYTYLTNQRKGMFRRALCLHHTIDTPTLTKTTFTLYDSPLVFQVYNARHSEAQVRRRWAVQRKRLARRNDVRIFIIEVHQRPGTENYYVTARIGNALKTVDSYLSRVLKDEDIKAVFVTRLTKKLAQTNKEGLSEYVFLTAGLLNLGFPVFHCFTSRYTEALMHAANLRLEDLRVENETIALTEDPVEPESPTLTLPFSSDYDQDTLIEHVQLLIRIGQQHFSERFTLSEEVQAVLKRQYEELQALYPDHTPVVHSQHELASRQSPCQH